MARDLAVPARSVLCAALALLPACATSRTLFLESDPPGARVILDGQVVGTTPYQEPIPAWGTRSLVLELPGHERLETDIELSTPWWDVWPIDFIAELLWPWPIVDDWRFRFVLPESVAAAQDWPAAEEAARRADEAARAAEGDA